MFALATVRLADASVIGRADRQDGPATAKVGQASVQAILTSLECSAVGIASRIALGWGEPGSDEVPLHYNAQVQHYMLLVGAMVCDIAVFIGGSDFRIYTVEADKEIAGALVEQERVFWEAVQSGQPPPPANIRDAVRRWGKLDAPGRVEAGANELDAIDMLRAMREQAADLLTQREAATKIIMQALGENGDTLVDANGTPLASWRLDSGRKAYSVAARDPQRRFLLR